MGFVLFCQAHALFSAVQTWYCFLQFRLGTAFCSSDLILLSAVQTWYCFLQFRLGSHNLPFIVSRFAGGQHVARANRVCIHCGGVTAACDMHMISEYPAL